MRLLHEKEKLQESTSINLNIQRIDQCIKNMHEMNFKIQNGYLKENENHSQMFIEKQIVDIKVMIQDIQNKINKQISHIQINIESQENMTDQQQ